MHDKTARTFGVTAHQYVFLIERINMIYQHDMKPNVFDERLIKSVDMQLDLMMMRNDDEVRKHLSPIQFLAEHRTLFTHLPRQVGKTTYIRKLLHHLSYKFENPILFVQNQSMVLNEYKLRTYTTSSHIRSIAMKHRGGAPVTHLLFDEVEPDIANHIVNELTMHSEFTKVKFVLGLYT